jgi:prepilin peptidase CpaA
MLFHRISNRLTGTLLCFGILVRVLIGGLVGLEQSLLGILVGLGCLLPFYILRAMGAGDVKLMAATGALLGPGEVWAAALCTLLAGAVLSVVYLASGTLRALVEAPAGGSWIARVGYAHVRVQEMRRDRLPYALAIAVGSFCAIALSGELTQAVNLLWGTV